MSASLHRIRLGRISALAGLLCLILPLTVAAQSMVDTIAGWQLQCRDGQGCVAVRAVSVGDRGPAQVMFAIGPQPQNIRLNIIGPARTARNDSVRVAAGNLLRTLPFETCVDGGCLAAANLAPDTLANMTELPQMVLTITSQTVDQPTDVVVPLDGLSAAVDTARAGL